MAANNNSPGAVSFASALQDLTPDRSTSGATSIDITPWKDIFFTLFDVVFDVDGKCYINKKRDDTAAPFINIQDAGEILSQIEDGDELVRVNGHLNPFLHNWDAETPRVDNVITFSLTNTKQLLDGMTTSNKGRITSQV